MKKIITTLLKQPWFYIVVAELLLFILFPLVDNPDWLYSFLPEAWYDVWEEFAVIHMERYLALCALLLISLSGALGFVSLFSCLHARKRENIIALMLYIFLTFTACGILLPTLGRAREKAKRIACTSNLKQIYLALDQYALDYQSHLPPDLKTLSSTDYLTGESIYRCMSRKRPNKEFSDYLYYGAGHKLDEKPAFILLRDRDKNHPGKYWNLLMSDGKTAHQIYTISKE